MSAVRTIGCLIPECHGVFVTRNVADVPDWDTEHKPVCPTPEPQPLADLRAKLYDLEEGDDPHAWKHRIDTEVMPLITVAAHLMVGLGVRSRCDGGRAMTTWSTGKDHPQNVYEGDRYAGVMFAPDDAARVVQAMNAGRPASDVPEPTDHTPVTISQEVQDALLSAGLDVRCYVHVGCGQHPSATVLSAEPERNYTTEESDRLAEILAPGAVYREQGQPGKRFGILAGRSRTGIDISIHCEPRMTPEEVAAAVSGR